MYGAIVFLPLVGFLIAGLFGRLIGARPAEVVTSSLMVISAVLAWIVFIEVGFSATAVNVPALGSWIDSGGLHVDWALRIDTLSTVMMAVVTTVSALVHIYSIGYMADDPSRPRFFAYLSAFTFAMLMLVTSDNLVQMFFGWEGVGLMSYLLIGFWYERPAANAAAIKAFVVNRVGDFGFALGVFLIFWLVNSVSFDTIFAAAPGLTDKTIHVFGMDVDALTIACLLLFMGAMGKSAQFLLHTWLPDAMEGPTPVSALIHAATMVTAGVFMVARLSPLFEGAPGALGFVTVVGGTTAFFAATVGLVQNDIKRVIAYSTCSQLGYMFVGLGVGGYSLGIFHLFTHAFFKALLFLSAGSVINYMHHEQDMRLMGGLRTKLPYTFWMMVIGTLALTGFPLTAGYFSKDAIIEAAYAASATSGAALYGFIMVLLVAGLTSFYSWRLIFMTFFGAPRGGASAVHAEEAIAGHPAAHAVRDEEPHEPHESAAPSLPMLVPLGVLAFGAIFAGLGKSFFIGDGYAAFWKGSLYQSDGNHLLAAMESVPFAISALPTLFMLIGLAIAYYMYVAAPEVPRQMAEANPILYRFLLNKWYFDEIYDVIFVRPAFWLGRLFWYGGDQRVIDGLGPDGVAARVLDATRGIVRLQSGYLYHYAFAMLIGLALLITWYLVGGGH